MYKKVDKEMVNRIYEKLQTKMHDLIDENGPYNPISVFYQALTPL